jgi:SlyX protein
VSTPPAGGNAQGEDGRDRMAEVEIKMVAMEDLLDTLNGTVFRQQQMIDRLAQALVELRQQMRSADPGTGGSDPRDEIPPHY